MEVDFNKLSLQYCIYIFCYLFWNMIDHTIEVILTTVKSTLTGNVRR